MNEVDREIEKLIETHKDMAEGLDRMQQTTQRARRNTRITNIIAVIAICIAVVTICAAFGIIILRVRGLI